jgi:hypothetical protein
VKRWKQDINTADPFDTDDGPVRFDKDTAVTQQFFAQSIVPDAKGRELRLWVEPETMPHGDGILYAVCVASASAFHLLGSSIREVPIVLTSFER